MNLEQYKFDLVVLRYQFLSM